MAEFCLRCMNKMDGTSLTKEDVISLNEQN